MQFNSFNTFESVNFQKAMYQKYIWNQNDNRKQSTTMTYDYQNINKFDIISDDEDFPLPQLKNIMSILSDKQNEELDSPIIKKVQIENLLEDIEIEKRIEEPIFQIQVQPSKPNDLYIYTSEQRSRRLCKINLIVTQQRTQSDIDSQSNDHITTPCNCSKSHCLKLYCQCFHKNTKCTELCKCIDCKNCDDHFQARQRALEKVKVKSQRLQHDNDLFNLSRVWGCKCQKSKCQKNYCECFLRNQKCNSSCRCKDCANKKRIPIQFKKKSKIETVAN